MATPSLLPRIGTIAGWKLALSTVTLPSTAGAPAVSRDVATYTSDDYRGSVDATMVSGLSAGSFTVVVEDVAEPDFKQLVDETRNGGVLQARLSLYWIDAGRPGAGDSPLVAVLRVTMLRRRPGKWRYEMVVEGREWAYDRLTARCPAITGDGALGTALNLVRALNVDIDAPPTPAATNDTRATDPGLRAVEQLRQLEAAMVAEAARGAKPRAGLGMYLIRDGRLRLGPDRITVPPALPTLAADTGLIVIERDGAVREDQSVVGIDDGNPPHRDLFVATLRGRPDLKPGDVVQFASPEQAGVGEEFGFALGPAPQVASGSAVQAYVQEVTHRLTREQGFTTVVRCVSAASGAGDLVERLWFTGAAGDSAASTGSSESVLARLFDRSRDAARFDRWPDVAQVRAQYLAGAPSPALTEKLWRGLEAADGQTYAAARQPFGKTRKELVAAPYATPFAYGSWGLVVPRYPGMRVLVVNRAGDPDDPVDVGALWTRGDGPAAQMGDWWLCLPVDLNGSQDPAASVADDDAAAPPTGGEAANDLIDAHGNRVIEVGKLTIRIGRNQLQSPSVRPAPDDDPVSIEHDGGTARITIAQDGAVTIASAKTLTLQANDGITLETDGNVSIAVGGNVDVQKKA